jgi:IS30 family transposase
MVPGHGEGDVLAGDYGRSHLVTLVERHSRYLIVLPLPNATSTIVVAELVISLGVLVVTQVGTSWPRKGAHPNILFACARP